MAKVQCFVETEVNIAQDRLKLSMAEDDFGLRIFLP